jgi:hypothetical protein
MKITPLTEFTCGFMEPEFEVICASESSVTIGLLCYEKVVGRRRYDQISDRSRDSSFQYRKNAQSDALGNRRQSSPHCWA